jgi:hypothetical protein
MLKKGVKNHFFPKNLGKKFPKKIGAIVILPYKGDKNITFKV